MTAQTRANACSNTKTTRSSCAWSRALRLAEEGHHALAYGARSPGAYEELEVELDSFHRLRIDAETITTALTAQRELATHSQHRVPIPHLLIAAGAHQHQAGVLHVDRHYETLARILAFTPVRLTT